jgi:hypothetical protein
MRTMGYDVLIVRELRNGPFRSASLSHAYLGKLMAMR